MRFFKESVLLAVACINAFCARSQSAADTVQHIDEVVVYGHKYKEVIPAQRLAGPQLQKLSSLSVADALRYFAGVQIKDYGGMGGLKTINVRNMGSHHVGVFFDGLQVGNAQNGVVDLGKFSLDDMEEVALYNGQKSEIFQSAKDFASASAVYLQTKRPSFAKEKGTNLLVRYKAGSINLVNPSARIEQRLSSRLSMSAGGEYTRSDGKYKFRYRRLNTNGSVAYDTSATRHNSDIEAFRAECAFFGKLSNGMWQAKLYCYQSDRGLPGAIVKNVFYNGERQADRNLLVQASLALDITNRYKLKASAKFADDYTHYLSRDTVLFLNDYVTKKMQFDNRYYQKDAYLSATHLYSICPWWDASLATDFQYNKLDASMRGVATPFSYPQRYSALAALATALDFGKLKVQGSLLGTFVTEEVRNNTKSPDKQELTPALFVGYKPFAKHNLSLRAFYKRIFRMPTFNDLYYAQIGYSQLKPEYTHQYNVGFTYEKRWSKSLLRRVRVQSDAYYCAITNKIIAAPTGSSFRWMMINMGFVETKGIDASASANMMLGKVSVDGSLSYSYSKAQDFTKINGQKMSSYGDQIPYTPWHSGSAIGTIGYSTWALNYSFIYVGERYDGAVNNIARNHVEPWYTHDLSVQKRFSQPWGSLKISIEANNLLNQYYDVVLNYPMPGRNYRFVLTCNI